jgi:hypothetical protein
MEGDCPTPHDAATLRRVFLVRLAAWGTVLVLAVIAFNVRAGASGGTEQGANGEQRNGTTSQHRGMWAVVDGERVRELGMTWDLECDNGSHFKSFSGTYHESDLRFDGRSLRGDDESESRADDDGWVAHYKSELSGTVGSDGSIAGDSAAVAWFQRGTERGAVCRSDPVGWSVPPA